MAVGEMLQCSREPTNVSTRYAVAVIKEGMTISHVLRRVLKLRSVFIISGGVISSEVTGTGRFSDGLLEKNFRTGTIFE